MVDHERRKQRTQEEKREQIDRTIMKDDFQEQQEHSKQTSQMMQDIKDIKNMLQAMIDQYSTQPSTTTNLPDKDPTIVPSDTIPSSSEDDSAPSTEFSNENPSNTWQKYGTKICSVEFVTDKYGINASDLDIYNMKVYYLFSKLRKIKENSHAVPEWKDLISSYKATRGEFVEQLKRDFQDCNGQRQEHRRQRCRFRFKLICNGTETLATMYVKQGPLAQSDKVDTSTAPPTNTSFDSTGSHDVDPTIVPDNTILKSKDDENFASTEFSSTNNLLNPIDHETHLTPSMTPPALVLDVSTQALVLDVSTTDSASPDNDPTTTATKLVFTKKVSSCLFKIVDVKSSVET